MKTRKSKYTKILHQGANKHKFFSKKSFPDRGKLLTKKQVLDRLCKKTSDIISNQQTL